MRIPKLSVVFASLLIFSMLLAGCIKSMDVEPADDGDDENGDGAEDNERPKGQNQQEPSPTPEPTPTEEEGEEKDDDPEEGDDTPADPTAKINANQTSGEAPLSVNFTLDGTTDESLSLNWTLDFGDGSDPVSGNQLPANKTHEYDEVGNYTAVLSVTDGIQTATDNVTITVEEEEEEPPEPAAADATIDIVDDPLPAYQDSTTMLPLTVVAGTTVKWIWQGAQSHSVTSDVTSGGSFDSGVQEPGAEFTATLEPGVYQYFCQIHPDVQYGVLVVTGEV